MTNETAKIFLTGIKDTKGLYRLADQLEALTKELYHNQEGFLTQKLKGKMLSTVEAIFAWLEQKGWEPLGDDEQKKFIEEIVSYLRKVPQVMVTLAFEPDELFIAKINDQISALVGQKVILDIKINNKIVGGVLLEYAGKYKDYSISPRVDNFLKETVTKFFPESLEAAKK